MKFVTAGDYRLEDWEDYLDNLPVTLAEQIEGLFDGSFDEWLAAFDAKSAKARRVMAWVVIREATDNPKLRIGDVDCAYKSIGLWREVEPNAPETDEQPPEPAANPTEAPSESETVGGAGSPGSLTGSESDPGSGDS